MITVAEIRAQLAEALEGRISFSDLDDWLEECGWNMHLDSSEDAQELVALAGIDLYEYANGIIDERVFREHLSALLQDHVAGGFQVSVAVCGARAARIHAGGAPVSQSSAVVYVRVQADALIELSRFRAHSRVEAPILARA